MFIAILEDTEMISADVTFDIFVQAFIACTNDVTVHCRVNQCDVCISACVSPK